MHDARTSSWGALLALLGALFSFPLSDTCLAAEPAPVTEGFLGVTTQDLTAPLREALGMKDEAGVLVNSVVPGSPAEQAGVEVGDVLLLLNEKELESPRGLRTAVSSLSAGETAELFLLRNSKKHTLRVEIGARPEEPAGAGRVAIGRSAYLGLQLYDPNADLASYFAVREGTGVLVLEVEEESPASEAGFLSGDLILAVGGEPTGTAESVRRALADRDPGETVEIERLRKGNAERVAVTLGEKPLLPWAGKTWKPFARFDREAARGFGETLERQVERLEKEMERLKKEIERMKHK
jgi:serine protease Do